MLTCQTNSPLTPILFLKSLWATTVGEYLSSFDKPTPSGGVEECFANLNLAQITKT